MQYRARVSLTYNVNGKERRSVTIEPGTLLEAVELCSLPKHEREAFERMAKREREREPNARLLYFRWMHVVRAARAGRDLEVVLPKRRTTRSSTRRTTRSRERASEQQTHEQHTSEQQPVATTRRRTRRDRTRWEDK